MELFKTVPVYFMAIFFYDYGDLCIIVSNFTEKWSRRHFKNSFDISEVLG